MKENLEDSRPGQKPLAYGMTTVDVRTNVLFPAVMAPARAISIVPTVDLGPDAPTPSLVT
jgi:hypothetical protein